MSGNFQGALPGCLLVHWCHPRRSDPTNTAQFSALLLQSSSRRQLQLSFAGGLEGAYFAPTIRCCERGFQGGGSSGLTVRANTKVSRWRHSRAPHHPTLGVGSTLNDPRLWINLSRWLKTERSGTGRWLCLPLIIPPLSCTGLIVYHAISAGAKEYTSGMQVSCLLSVLPIRMVPKPAISVAGGRGEGRARKTQRLSPHSTAQHSTAQWKPL